VSCTSATACTAAGGYVQAGRAWCRRGRASTP
jgi:hypothetical protein